MSMTAFQLTGCWILIGTSSSQFFTVSGDELVDQCASFLVGADV